MSITRTGEDTFLRGILEGLETGLVVVDGSGTIVFSNDAAGELLGRSPERLSALDSTTCSPTRTAV